MAATRWLLRRAQAAMVEACDAAGVELLVFHGRGGSISVGGGRTDALVQALPPGALRGRLRVTEQGESINERYGLRAIALRSFEQSRERGGHWPPPREGASEASIRAGTRP